MEWYYVVLIAIGALAVGFGLLLVVMEGSKPLLNLIFKGNFIAYTVRYFLTVLFAGCVWPLTFKWFGKLGTKKEKAIAEQK